jgi:hypothetical protein
MYFFGNFADGLTLFVKLYYSPFFSAVLVIMITLFYYNVVEYSYY